MINIIDMILRFVLGFKLWKFLEEKNFMYFNIIGPFKYF